jgi:hypothetical protein
MSPALDQKASHQLTAEHRPFGAALMCAAVAELADAVTAEGNKKDGRWLLNTGAEMTTYVSGVNTDQYGYSNPFRLVIDLAKAKFEKPIIPALYAHASWSIIGNWRSPTVDEKKVSAELTLYRPKDATEAQVLPEALKVAVLIDRDHPWQCSVGAFPRDGLDGYELVKAGKTVTLNGREFSGDGEYPLYVMRRPIIYEASIVLWGADGNTGKLAASLLNPLAHLELNPNPDKDHHMTTSAAPVVAPTAALRLKALLASLTDIADQALVAKLMSEDKADDAIAAAVHASQLKRRDDKITELEAKIVELSKKPEAPTTKVEKPKVEASAKTAPPFTASAEGETPKNLGEAVKLMRAENPKLNAAKLTTLAYQRWPELQRPQMTLPKG